MLMYSLEIIMQKYISDYVVTDEQAKHCSKIVVNICHKSFVEGDANAQIVLGPRAVKELYELWIEMKINKNEDK